MASLAFQAYSAKHRNASFVESINSTLNPKALKQAKTAGVNATIVTGNGLEKTSKTLLKKLSAQSPEFYSEKSWVARVSKEAALSGVAGAAGVSASASAATSAAFLLKDILSHDGKDKVNGQTAPNGGWTSKIERERGMTPAQQKTPNELAKERLQKKAKMKGTIDAQSRDNAYDDMQLAQKQAQRDGILWNMQIEDEKKVHGRFTQQIIQERENPSLGQNRGYPGDRSRTVARAA